MYTYMHIYIYKYINNTYQPSFLVTSLIKINISWMMARWLVVVSRRDKGQLGDDSIPKMVNTYSVCICISNYIPIIYLSTYLSIYLSTSLSV